MADVCLSHGTAAVALDGSRVALFGFPCVAQAAPRQLYAGTPDSRTANPYFCTLTLALYLCTLRDPRTLHCTPGTLVSFPCVRDSERTSEKEGGGGRDE